MDAAMMMLTPRITAAAMMAAATFLFSMISFSRCPGVHLFEHLEADDGGDNADGGKNQHVADGHAERLRAPGGGGDCVRREQRRRDEQRG